MLGALSLQIQQFRHVLPTASRNVDLQCAVAVLVHPLKIEVIFKSGLKQIQF